jgi:hypothetical protein
MIAEQVQGALAEINGAINRPESSSADALFSSDPHKGRFGGSATANGLILELESWEKCNDPAFLALRLTVRSTNGTHQSGIVRFFLHPTFDPSIELVHWRSGRASFICYAMGGFTLGAETEDGTKLELDLALIDQLPKWFRDR